jgi:hypothetical protein
MQEVEKCRDSAIAELKQIDLKARGYCTGVARTPIRFASVAIV